MITLFKSNETDFTHNGLGNLDAYIQNPVVEEEINGLYSFGFRYPLFAPHGLEIEGESIVRVPVPEKEDQLFRVYRHVKSMGYITVSCFHIFYDLADNFIEDTNIVEKDGQGAIQQLGGATQFGHRFRFYSDIQTVANARVVRKNVVGAILDDEQGNSFVSRWGGELIRNNFDVRMNQSAGSNRGFTVKHRKNLTGYEADVDESTVYTRIMPKGFDGLLLPEKYIDSPLIGNYESPKIKMIDYEVKAAIGEYANDEDAIPLEDAYAELRRLAKEEYTIHKIDIPTVSYRVDFVMLEQTEEYKDLADLQKLKMGDMVTVDHELDDFKVTAKLVRYKYDPIAERYLLAELGSIHEGITSNFTDIKKINREVTELKEQTLIIQATADGKNTIYRGTAEPGNPNVGDLWYKPNGSETQMYQYVDEDGVKYWKLIADTGDLTKVEKDIESALEEVEEAKQSAQTAVDTANQSKADAESAINKANESFGKAENALASSSMALQQSADAYDKSLDAFDKAEDGLAQANAALTKAQEGFNLAQENAEEIEGIGFRIGDVEKDFTTISGNIQGLQTQVGNIAGDLNTVTQTANANKKDLQNARGDINSLTQTATAMQNRLANAEGDINTITNLATGTQQSLVNLQGDFTRLSTTVGGLQTEVNKKVDQTTYNTKVQQLDNAISQRVTKTDADTLYTQKSEFSVFADGFSQRVDAIEGWEIGGRNLLLVENKRNWADASSRIGEQNNWRGWFAKVESNSMYSISRQNLSSRFRYYLLTEEPFVGMSLAGLSNSHDNDLVIEGIRTKSDTEYIFIYYSNAGEEDPLIKLEKGNKATDWTPAPEDTDQKFSAITQTIDNIDSRVQTNASNYSSISQTVQGIQNTVKDKANQSEVTQLSNLLNTTITSKADKSEVTQLSNLVDTKVTSSQVNSLIASDKQIKDTRNDNQKPSWYFSNYPRQTVREFKQNSVLGISSDGTYGVLETAIQWSNTSGGKVKQILYTDAATYERRGNNTNDTWESWKKVADVDYVEGRITVLNNAINLRVKEGEVLSQINIEANRTLIQSNKLILDADTVTVTGTFRVKSANIESVDAGKMTTGTLNAAQVNIINLNASNITSGYINVSRLTGMTSTFITSLWNNLSSQVSITGSGLETFSGGQRTSLLNGSGHNFYRNNMFIGTIGTSNWSGDSNYRGLRFGLENNADYMSWGFMTTSSASAYTTVLAWHKTGSKSNKGFTLSDHVTMTENVEVFGNLRAVDYVSTNRLMTNYGSDSRELVLQNYSYNERENLSFSGVSLSRGGSGGRVFVETNRAYLLSGRVDGYVSGLSVGRDSGGGFVQSKAIYLRTASASANIHVNDNGTVMRSTSASKYKLSIEKQFANESEQLNHSLKILNLNISTWFDKFEAETLAKECETGKRLVDDDFRLQRHTGLIAEDVERVGLSEHVIYGIDGQVEGIAYDRLPIHLIPIVRHHHDEISILKQQNEELTNQLEQAIFKIADLEQRLYKLEAA